MNGRRARGTVLLAVLLAAAACGGDATGISDSSHGALEISGPLSVEVGESITLSAAIHDSDGSAQPTGTIAWSSSDPSLIEITGDGTVRALRIGSVTIKAAAEGQQATATVTSSLTPYTFVFPASLPAADQQLIRDGVQYADEFQRTTLGRTIEEPTTVTGALTAPGCAAGGAAAFTGPQTVTFCLDNPGWTTHGPVIKQKIVQHELFHVWQFEYGWLGSADRAGAMWVIEGSAELMAFRGLDARGVLSFATAIGCQVKESADFARRMPPGLPSLESVETRQAFQTTIGPLYTHSMLAMDELTHAGGLTAIRAYGDAIAAGTSWQAAFETAFGVTPADFYGAFPSYLASLPVPPNYLCGV